MKTPSKCLSGYIYSNMLPSCLSYDQCLFLALIPNIIQSVFLFHCASLFTNSFPWAFKWNPVKCCSCPSVSSKTGSNSDGMWKYSPPRFPRISGAYNHRPLLVFSVLQLSLVSTTKSLTLKIVEFNYWLVWEIRERSYYPAHNFCCLPLSTWVWFSILSLHILFILNCSTNT